MEDREKTNRFVLDRRAMLGALGAGFAGLVLSPFPAVAKGGGVLAKRIPSTGEAIPVIGMGTWITFNVGGDRELRGHRTKILKTFFEMGGGVIDSSPMYGSSQDVVGYGLKKLGMPEHLFSADKIWTGDGDATREQFAETADKWNVKTFDLMQVHNLVSWREHLDTLRQMKDEGKVRYIGITTSHGRRHRELEKIMKTEALDFVQLTYNMVDREVEKRLLPVAKDRGIAVIANRPFRGGSLIDAVQRGSKDAPRWAKEFDALNWPQFLLKWIVSHPAVTCAIPATSQVVHMKENMGACRGELPDAKMRARMLAHLESYVG
jgi:diketogulonate reductase-like aldo/keto reductase